MRRFLANLVSTGPVLSALGRLNRAMYRESRCIVISAMPKSGSTFLSNALAGIVGYEHGYAACNYFNVEQELYRPKLIDNYGKGIVVQQHFKANPANLQLLQEFGLRPIVQVRNIFDVVVSLRDHLMQERLGNIPAVYPSSQFREFDQSAQFDYIVECVVPWYLSYFASWYEAAEARRIDFLWVVYEDAGGDWPGTIERVLHFYEIGVDMDRVAQVVEYMKVEPRAKTRLNVGVSGRGRATLSAEQQARIVALTRHYPEIDFSRIGIGRVAPAAP